MTTPEPPLTQGPGRLERRKARTRAAIVEAAESLFHAQGYDETSIQQIAERADTGVGTLYGYYPSKEDILRAVLRQSTSEALAQYLATASAGTPPIERICGGLAAFAEYIRGNRRVLLASFEMVARARRYEEMPARQLAVVFETIINEGIAAGTISPVPPETAASLLVGAYLQAMLGIGVWFGREDDPRTDRELEALVRALLTP